jgi:hypothetical protein
MLPQSRMERTLNSTSTCQLDMDKGILLHSQPDSDGRS